MSAVEVRADEGRGGSTSAFEGKADEGRALFDFRS
jgi:hypothetical protein